MNRKQNNLEINKLKVDDKIIEDPEEISILFNEYFINVTEKLIFKNLHPHCHTSEYYLEMKILNIKNLFIYHVATFIFRFLPRIKVLCMSLKHTGPGVWETIPQEIKDCNTLHLFKNKLKNFLITKTRQQTATQLFTKEDKNHANENEKWIEESEENEVEEYQMNKILEIRS
ncbi:hypothetical protein HELRODRAFT_162029 [Helobdella robusta]|uniref:Uncharacterized protein n=1 Tax=Helobdella robusta TaxID=6412 RepID=T1ES57_HELRO|nr:hypothetical protein HELRODRAFT_162029 [Helobdella robusta]ESN98596.1 hypothetical protein HELRODRAFT_162029 [Helobdella robusta]